MPTQHDLAAAKQDIDQGRPDYARKTLWRLIHAVNTPPAARAAAFVLLADTYLTNAEKRACYGQALQLYPAHPDALRGLSKVALPPGPAARPTVAPPPPPPQNRPVLAEYYQVVGVLNGPNGAGSGFFVSQDGLVATTRHVVGGTEQVTIEITPTQRFQGIVVWSSPQYDLALVAIPLTIQSLMPMHHQTVPIAHEQLSVYTYQNDILYARLDQPITPPPAGWFATDLKVIWDAGGSPLLNRSNAVVGMLTRNCSRQSPELFAVSVQVILDAVHAYEEDKKDGLPRRYCTACGQRPWADLAHIYCPLCGTSFSEDWLNR